MITFWYVIMMIILVMITVLLPFAQFMYETDEDDTVVISFLFKFNHSRITFFHVDLLLLLISFSSDFLMFFG